MRVLIAGGGTGGHVIPALAIARELQARYNAELLFVGTARGIENRLVPKAGYKLELVKVGALKNVGLLTRLRTLFDLILFFPLMNIGHLVILAFRGPFSQHLHNDPQRILASKRAKK